MGYITAVESLKVVTETSITNSLTGVLEEKKYKVVGPELMHEAFLSDSEDEGGEEHLDHHQYKYMATDDLKTSNDQDHQNYDTTITTEQDHVDNASHAMREPNKGNYLTTSKLIIMANKKISNPYILNDVMKFILIFCDSAIELICIYTFVCIKHSCGFQSLC